MVRNLVKKLKVLNINNFNVVLSLLNSNFDHFPFQNEINYKNYKNY